MKSSIWVAYILIFIFSAIYVFKHEKYTKRIEILNGYCVNFSVNKGQNLDFYLNPKVAAKKGYITINNLKGEVIDSFLIELHHQISIDEYKIEQDPNLYKEKFTFNTSTLNKGLYLLGNKIPFLIKDTSKRGTIQVMFPFLSLHAISNKGGKSFINHNSSNHVAATRLSLKRTLVIDDYTKNILAWLGLHYPDAIDVFCDYEIENHKLLSNDILILYGNCDYIPLNVKKTIEKSIYQGTNALVISSTLFRLIIKHDKVQKTIEFYDDSSLDPEKVDSLKSGFASDPLFNDNTNYQFGMGTQITNSTLFDSLSNSVFYFKENLIEHLKSPVKSIRLRDLHSLSGIEVNAKAIKKDEKYKIHHFEKYEKFEILAEAKQEISANNFLIGNIVYLKKAKQSGKQISIGCNDWLNENNLNDIEVTNYTKFLMEYLRINENTL
jgi:hypothetical protein